MNLAPQFPVVLHNPARQFYYTLTHRLGGGGFGEVWAAFMHSEPTATNGHLVAVKIIRPTQDPQKDFSTWYTEQTIHLRCLNHPHIVTTYDQFVCPRAGLILVMEKGQQALAEFLIQVGRFPLINVCLTGIQVCSALEHVHSLNVIHRDVTLRNLLWFNGGTVKLADFGISKMLQDHQQQVESKTGIFNTVPPELAFLGYSTTQSDIYQLGLVLLTLLTGSNPIPETDRDMARQMIHNGVPRACAEQLIPSVGPLAEVISVMLRRRTEYRYRNATEVRDALQNVANTLRSTSPFGSFVTPNPSP